MATPPAGQTARAGGLATAASPSAAAGLATTGVSIALTFTVAVLGPSVMEPPLPGRAGQPPWALAADPSPYLVVALTAAAILAGAAGLALLLGAARRGWSVRPAWVLAAGFGAAVALALVPPFGSSDHLSYAAYGRMALTGHDPYTMTPAALARLGDPVARAVEDWRHSPSVYGALATAGQALASLIGGTSARLTVFVLSLLDVAAFTVTGLLLHRLARGDRVRQLRCALLWSCNPLLLQVLIAGAHVDSQAIVFGVAALAVVIIPLAPAGLHLVPPAGLRPVRPTGDNPADSARPGPARPGFTRASWAGLGTCRLAVPAAAAGALIGLGFAVKVTTALVGVGLAVGCLLAWRVGAKDSSGRADLTGLAAALAGLAAGFAVAAGGSLLAWGPGSLFPALRAGSYVSIASPWRAVRSALHLVLPLGPAEDLVKAGAVVLALILLALLLRSVSAAGPDRWPVAPRLAGQPQNSEPPSLAGPEPLLAVGPEQPSLARLEPSSIAGPERLPAALSAWVLCAVFAVVLAWLFAWPYVLPWYDGLGWALLALLPASRLDWLMLARTTALAAGYLPARGIVMPAGLGWLETVVRTAISPLALLAVTAILIMLLWPGHVGRLAGPVPGRPGPRWSLQRRLPQ